jgi:hypothetical protein
MSKWCKVFFFFLDTWLDLRSLAVNLMIPVRFSSAPYFVLSIMRYFANANSDVQ